MPMSRHRTVTSLELMPGLFATFDRQTVDQIIASDAKHARFVAGLVLWQQGELRDEIGRGAWYVLEPDVGVALRKPTQGLWEELVRRRLLGESRTLSTPGTLSTY